MAQSPAPQGKGDDLFLASCGRTYLKSQHFDHKFEAILSYIEKSCLTLSNLGD
jgi:hypothetical protein